MILTKKQIKNIIFDLDGTLIDSADDVLRILIKNINKNGGNLSLDTKIKMGPPLIDMIESVVPQMPAEIKHKIVDDFRNEYENESLDKTLPFGGAVEFLTVLKKAGFNIFVATYKPKYQSIKVLEKYFKDLYLDVVTPTEIEDFQNSKTKTDILRLIVLKWGISPDETIMVGDAKTDIICAKEIGMFTAAALWGYGENYEFVDADIKLNSITELYQDMQDLVKEKEINEEQYV